MLSPAFVDHLVFRVADLRASEPFYTALLGEPPYRTGESIMYQAGDTLLFFTACDPKNPVPYDKEQIGLNHLAFGLRSIEELKTIVSQLDTARVQHSGIQKDRYGHKDFIWLDDPDGMRIEFYVRPLE